MSAFLVVLGALLAPVLGCALVSRGKALEVKWYTPERIRTSPGVAERQGECELHLGSVTSGADLGPRIVFGDGVYEVGRYSERRWTERPEHYVQRALARRLFEEGSFRRSGADRAPKLEAELLDFEEVKATPHTARVAVRIVVTSDHVVLERTVTVTRPIVGDAFEGFVAAMSGALEAAADDVALSTQAALRCP
jgi:ABC-type uncharacterized transport system auxiliary subunit